MSDTPKRPMLPGEVAALLARTAVSTKASGQWSPQCGIDLAVAIVQLVQRQVAGIPGAPDFSVASEASKTAAAFGMRDVDEKKLTDWIMILLQRTVTTIFKSRATEIRLCKGYHCKQVLAMVPDYSRGGMLIPFNIATGVNHFIECPDRERFKRPAGSVDPKKPLPPDPVTRTVNAVDAAQQMTMFDRSRRPE